MNIQKSIDYLDFKITHFEDQLLTYENEKLAKNWLMKEKQKKIYKVKFSSL